MTLMPRARTPRPPADRPPLSARMSIYAACFSRAMERDCPVDERARLTAAMAMLVPATTRKRQPSVKTLGDFIRDAIDERLHGEP